ncbi:Hypothetical predicted protein [Pelobates cultripes]|uniref:Uncharacterized protein n=1 Tax=Pelobates cultripes TaxID=61616 RepID=A0AAD1VUK4_PELCU|nr:Hypothetical predicted protein [Pelobates cultripes]
MHALAVLFAKLRIANNPLRVFSLLKEHQFRCVGHIDLHKERLKFLNKLKDQGKFEKSDDITYESCTLVGGKSDDSIDSGLPILHIQQCEPSSLNDEM